MTQNNSQETVNKDQEIVISNNVTKNILDKYEVESITQEEFEKREQKSTDESAVNENQQVNNDNEVVEVDITDNDLKVLADAGVTEESLEGKTLAEIKQIVIDNTPKQEAQVSQDQEVVISDTLAESLSAQYPFAKNLKGKSLNEVMEIIQNQNSYITQLEQRKNANVNDQNSNSQQISKTSDETSLSESEVIDLLNLRPEEATKKINEMIQANGKKVAETVFDEKIKNYLPNIDKVNQVAVEQEKKIFFESLGSKLPKGTDPKAVFDGWMAENKSKLSMEEKKALVANPNLLIKLVSNDHNFKTTSTEKQKIEVNNGQTIKKATYENLRKLLKSNQGSGAVFNFQRTNSNSNDLSRDENAPENPMIDNILKKYEKEA